MSVLAAAGLAMPADGVHRVDFRASTYTASAQEEADLAVGPDGSITAVWSSRRQNGGKYGVFGQRFDARGVAIGEEFSLSAWRENHQLAPAVASTRLGTTWAVWQSHEQDGEAGAVVARLFDGEGNASAEILVNQTTMGHQATPVVAALRSGGAVVAWEDIQRGGARRVLYRVFDASGHPIGDETAVSAGEMRQGSASIAAGGHGFAIAWSEFDRTTAEPRGVRVRMFSDRGEAMGEAVSPAGEVSVEPVIEAAGEGYILAWIDAESGEQRDSYDVLAMRLDATGHALGDPIVANDVLGGVQNAPAIAVREDGAIAIAYNSDEAKGRGVHARLFDGALSPMGSSFVVTNVGEGDRLMREAVGTGRLAFGASGELLCAWSGDAGLGDGSSANVSMASATALEAGLERGVVESMCAAPFGNLTDGAAGPHVPPTFRPLDRDRDRTRVEVTPEGVGFLAISNTGWTPPDPHMAVGPEHIVVMSNGQIAFFEKDGTNTFRDEIEDSFGFWGSVGATGFVFDPEVLYDPEGGRFIAMAAEAFAPGGRSFVLIAVSDDSDPNGTWNKYRFDTTSLGGDLFDSPNIAVTGDAVVVTGDGFGLGANYAIFTWDKASLYAGDPPSISRQTTLATSTQSAGIPPTSLPDPGVLHMIEHQEGEGRTQVRLIAMRDALGSPSFVTTQLDVDSYGAPADPAQQGSGSRPNTFDARFWSAKYVNGRLWATHHVSSPVVRARWYEIDLRGWPDSGDDPALVQSGEIQPDGNTHTFFSSIAASEDGVAGVCYSQSSTSEFISMRTAYRLPGDPPGTMRLGEAQQTTVGPYTQGRWGDYSACEIDPADGSTIWSHHEFAENNSWRTWVASIATSGGCPPDLDGDGDVDGDDFFEYLDAFAGGNLGVCDIDEDGDCDGDDFFAYLDLFSLGC